MAEAACARQTRASRFYTCRKCCTHITSNIDNNDAAENPINLKTGNPKEHSYAGYLTYANVSCTICNMVLGVKIIDLDIGFDFFQEGKVLLDKKSLHLWNGSEMLDPNTLLPLQ